jgi:hypothetical protein
MAATCRELAASSNLLDEEFLQGSKGTRSGADTNPISRSCCGHAAHELSRLTKIAWVVRHVQYPRKTDGRMGSLREISRTASDERERRLIVDGIKGSGRGLRL